MLDDEDWKLEAACRTKPTSMFYPERPSHGLPAPMAEIRAALEVCARCPVTMICLEYALQRKEVGIWGGTTENERRKMKSRRNRGHADWMMVR